VVLGLLRKYIATRRGKNFFDCESFCYDDDGKLLPFCNLYGDPIMIDAAVRPVTECGGVMYGGGSCSMFKRRPDKIVSTIGDPLSTKERRVSFKGTCKDTEEWYKDHDWFEAGTSKWIHLGSLHICLLEILDTEYHHRCR
jgi:hypothetical protein